MISQNFLDPFLKLRIKVSNVIVVFFWLSLLCKVFFACRIALRSLVHTVPVRSIPSCLKLAWSLNVPLIKQSLKISFRMLDLHCS